MVRYFINYEDYIEKKNINDIDLYYLQLFNKKKNKKGLYTFIPLTNEFEIYNYINKNNNKKNLMVELFDNELKNYNDLFIKEYSEVNDGLYKKVYHNKQEYISLIKYHSLINMNMDEINKGDIVILEPCLTDDKYFYLSSLRTFGININKKRKELFNKEIGSDIYLYTNDIELLKRYEDSTIQIKEIECNKYKIINNEIYVLDALKKCDLIGLSSANYLYLDMISSDAVSIYINENYGDYNISINNDNYGTKAYLITNPDFKKMLSNKEIVPLLKYINIYTLNEGKYEKKFLYKKDNNILKYKRIDRK